MRACLASILECDIDDIPPIEDLPDHEWFKVFCKWLDSVGLEYEGIRHLPSEAELDEYEGIDGYTMAYGPSPRTFVKAGHAVVYKGSKFVHDPHPSGDGILNLEGIYMIRRKDLNEDRA